MIMLDIIFYSANNQDPNYIELSENIYEWLARSKFSKIGKSLETKIKIDGEEESLPLVPLDQENRRQLRLFFLEAIANESDVILTQLEAYDSKATYQQAIYRLRKLQELRKCVENENYQYLQRV